ncbi:MAG: hypothetical protein P4L84_07255 [Isosphaeraceae bacterium]|nr:hypothetical protein [Isosphaeraceae bacterium]
MRTDQSTSAGMLGARVRAQVQRAGRTWREQGPVLRWGLGAAALALLGAIFYLSVSVSSGNAFVSDGQVFKPDDLVKIKQEFRRKHIPCREDDQRRLLVPADSLSEANDAVAKLNVGAKSLDDLWRPDGNGGLLETPWDRDRRVLQARGERLAEMIRRLPDSGIIAAHVEIQRLPASPGMRSSVHPTAFVLLETERDRAVRFQIIKTIEEMIVASEAGMKPDAISIFDQGGHHYIDALKPEVREQTHIHAREEELSEKILDRIDHIKGVQVTVQMVPVAPSKPEPAVKPEPAHEPVPAEPSQVADLLPPPIAVNQPVEIVPEPKPKPDPAPPPAPVAAKPESSPAQGLLARVWVKVPRSWYLRMHPSPTPSPDELRKSKEETERQIHTAVEHTVPPGEASEVKIDTIADEQPARPTAAVPVASGARDVRWVWLLSGLLVGVAATLVPLGLHLAAARRPAPQVARQADLGWFHVDEAGEAGPGPSERVRELIRLNPEAAASVLHRWTGRGGPVE